ncbi:hypothetical protein BaRGS_00004718 [Batillaria attramentaria]|uniref:Uncharacterized protein n=1 Tax=Batillaria attramentaria TaxID=370345 RepID=A0ABD0LXX9_9CAEN
MLDFSGTHLHFNIPRTLVGFDLYFAQSGAPNHPSYDLSLARSHTHTPGATSDIRRMGTASTALRQRGKNNREQGQYCWCYFGLVVEPVLHVGGEGWRF